MQQHSLIAFLAVLFPYANSLPTESPSPLTPLPPSTDPFYTAPEEFSQYPPGSILRIRHAPGNITSVVTNSSTAYNILYRTTNALYEPSWAVTTFFVPLPNIISPKQNSTASLLSIQLPYNSADVDASPSYALYGSLSQASGDIPPSTDDIAAALGNGWYVNVPDHEGPTASFGLGIQEGHATIDSIRAVLSSGLISSISKENVKSAMWGYSGGSIASEWAAELQEQYAPELHFSGAALGGLVPNLTAALDNITASPYAGLIPEALLGITSQYPDAYSYLLSRLHTDGPFNSTVFLSAKNMDVNQAFVTFAGQNIFDYFVGGRADIESPSSAIQAVLNKNGYMGYHGVPQMPIFLYKAIGDEFTRGAVDTDALVERWCGIGVEVRYERNEVGGHIAEITNGRGRALEWLKELFDGEIEQGVACDIRNVSVVITDNPA